MEPRDLLVALIDASIEALAKPVLCGAKLDAMLALQKDTQAAHARLGEARLIFDEEVLLADALVMHARAAGSIRSAASFARVIGVLLPDARSHLMIAMQPQRVSTTDQDYAPGRDR